LQSEDYLTIEQGLFFKHIEHLAANYSIIQIRDVLTFQTRYDNLPPNPIIISFDDSLKDNIEYALPILDQFKVSAIFFIIAGYLGKNNAWNHRAYRFSNHMNSDDLKNLIQAGYEIGSHSLTHQRLTKLSNEQLKKEFAESRQIITDIIGVSPDAFSYPYGGVDKRCSSLCGKYYKLGFSSSRQGYSDWTVDPMNIQRIYVSPDDQPKDLDQKIIHYWKTTRHE
jgi:peptidoglycan/xylan/chitin deacetylase (PgdA/CDA1 family)